MTLERYLGKQIFFHIVSILMLTIALLSLENMLKLIKFTLQTSGPFGTVIKMLAFLIPEYMAIGVPIGLMLGIIIVFQKLANRQEFAAMLACRATPLRLLKMPLIYGLVFACLNAALVSYIQPYAEFRFEELLFKARSGALGRSITVGEFTDLGPGVTFFAESVDGKTGKIGGIFVEIADREGATSFFSSVGGQFLQSAYMDTLILRMTDGTLVTNTLSDSKTPPTASFEAFDLTIPLPELPAFRSRGSDEKERTLLELIRIGSDETAAAAVRRAAGGEALRRIIWALFPLTVPLLAMALAVPPPRRKSSAATVVGLGAVILMIKVLDFGSNVQGFAPALILVPVFTVFCVFCWRMFYIASYTVGRHPLSGLFRVIDKVEAALTRRRKARGTVE